MYKSEMNVYKLKLKVIICKLDIHATNLSKYFMNTNTSAKWNLL